MLNTVHHLWLRLGINCVNTHSTSPRLTQKAWLGVLAQQPLIVLIPTFLLCAVQLVRPDGQKMPWTLSQSLLPLIQKKAFLFLLSSLLFWLYRPELYFCGSLSPHLVPGSGSSSSRSRQLFLSENAPPNWVHNPCLARKSGQIQLATSWWLMGQVPFSEIGGDQNRAKRTVIIDQIIRNMKKC